MILPRYHGFAKGNKYYLLSFKNTASLNMQNITYISFHSLVSSLNQGVSCFLHMNFVRDIMFSQFAFLLLRRRINIS